MKQLPFLHQIQARVTRKLIALGLVLFIAALPVILGMTWAGGVGKHHSSAYQTWSGWQPISALMLMLPRQQEG